jgi:hypothetical protein
MEGPLRANHRYLKNHARPIARRKFLPPSPEFASCPLEREACPRNSETPFTTCRSSRQRSPIPPGARLPYREVGALVDAERLATKLLSSMPLTFNLLAPWGHTPERASGYLRELLPAFTGSTQEGLQQPVSKVMPCRPPIGTVFLTVDARAAPRPIRHATYKFSRGLAGEMKSNAAMAAISAAGHAMAGGKTFDEISPTT